MQARDGVFTGARAVALALAALCVGSTACAGAVRVSVAGKIVEANAETAEETVVGEILPVLDALGVPATYEPAAGRLSGRLPDGRAIEAVAGQASLSVAGSARECKARFRDVGGRMVGPIREVATAAGCAVRFDKSGQELRIAHRLAQVEAYASDEASLIHITVSGATTPELRHLIDPPRAYADFPGLTWTGKTEAIRVGGAGGLKRVRWALFQEWPPVTRVVVDLLPGAQASMSQVEDRLYLITVRPPGATEPTRPVEERSSRAGLENAHIVLDPAGGGDDAGARGAKTTGKAVNLDVAVRAAVELMNAGALVTLTRDTDVAVPTQDRVRLIRGVSPDVVVRIECGAAQARGERGIETRYSGNRARPLAVELQKALVRKTRARDRGAVQSDAFALPGVDAPAVTCIVGYVTCPDEDKLLASSNYRNRTAIGLAEGIAAYLNSSARTRATEPQREPGT